MLLDDNNIAEVMAYDFQYSSYTVFTIQMIYFSIFYFLKMKLIESYTLGARLCATLSVQIFFNERLRWSILSYK